MQQIEMGQAVIHMPLKITDHIIQGLEVTPYGLAINTQPTVQIPKNNPIKILGMRIS